MPDITMCQDRECPMARRCRRSELVTTPGARQSWFAGNVRGGDACEFFWESDEGEREDH